MITCFLFKLIEQSGNKYIIQLNTTNVLVLVEKQNENYIKLFKKGELMFEFKDVKKSEFSFVRTIQDQRYTFENNKLISTEILTVSGNVIIYPLYEDTNAITLKNITPFKDINNSLIALFKYIYVNKKAELFILFKLFLVFLVYIFVFVIFPESNANIALAAFSSKNIIKLRRVDSKYN
jgi:hypothetical protein